MSTAADGQVQPGWEPATGWSHVAVGCWPLKSGLAGVEGGSPGRQRKNEREEMETVGCTTHSSSFTAKGSGVVEPIPVGEVMGRILRQKVVYVWVRVWGSMCVGV